MQDRVNRIATETKLAYLSSDFGLELALKKTGLSLEQLTALVGVYKRGPRKGKLKGHIQWLKVTRGGWVKTGAYDWEEMRASGFVCKVGVCFAFSIEVAKWGEAPEHKWGDVWEWGYPKHYERLLAERLTELNRSAVSA